MRFYAFDQFKIDVEQRLLWRAEEELHLIPRVFDVLLVLVRQAGKIVSKDALMKEVWGETIVEEGNLTEAISKLRRVLGDDARAPRYIQNIPKQGYRFIAAVTGEAALKPPNPAPRRNWKTVGGLLAGLGLVVLLGVIIVPRPSKPVDVHPVRVYGMPGETGETIGRGRFSPNARRMALEVPGTGRHIIVKDLPDAEHNQSQERQATTGPWRDTSPIWSPDGDKIAFLSNRSSAPTTDTLGIWQVSDFASEPELLLRLPDGQDSAQRGRPLLVAWPTAQEMYYEWEHNLYRIKLAARAIEKLTNFTTSAPQEFALSLDQQRIAYVAQQDGQFDIWWQSLSGGEPQRLTNDAAADRYPLWHPNGRQLLYNSWQDGVPHLFRVDASGGNRQEIAPGQTFGTLNDISHDGQKLLCEAQSRESDIYALDVATQRKESVAVGYDFECWPQVSADYRVVFQSLPKEQPAWSPLRSTLYVKALSFPGAGPGAAEKSPHTQALADKAFAAQWSPDGKHLAFLRPAQSAYDLWVAETTGNQTARALATGVTYGGNLGRPWLDYLRVRDYDWAHDSQQLAYSAKENGASTLNVRRLHETTAQRISTEHTPLQTYSNPLWSPDDNRLAYLTSTRDPASQQPRRWRVWCTTPAQPQLLYETTSDVRLLGWLGNDAVLLARLLEGEETRAAPFPVELLRVDIAPQSAPIVLTRLTDTYFTSLFFAPDERNVSFVKSQGNRRSLWLLPVLGRQAGTARQLLEAAPDEYLAGLAWSPDSRYLFYSAQKYWNIMILLDNPE